MWEAKDRAVGAGAKSERPADGWAFGNGDVRIAVVVPYVCMPHLHAKSSGHQTSRGKLGRPARAAKRRLDFVDDAHGEARNGRRFARRATNADRRVA